MHVPVPTDLTYPKLEKVAEHLEHLIGAGAISLNRDRNVVRTMKVAVPLFQATEQWKTLQKVTEGLKDGVMTPFQNFEPLKQHANVWAWFAAEGKQEPIVADFLRAFFGEEDYAQIEDLVGGLTWGKDGNVHLDFPTKGTGLTLWMLLPLKLVKRLDPDAKQNVKMRFSLVKILGGEALVEAVSEQTKKSRIKEVFQSNHFQLCDKVMMNDLRDFIPTKEDMLSNGMLKDLFGGDDTRAKNYNCVLPDKPFTPEIKPETDTRFRKLIEQAIEVVGGIQGVANKHSKYNDALYVEDGRMFGREGYTHGGDMFPRWYFYVMQQCAESSAWSCPTCQKYNKSPGRWGPFVGESGLHLPANSYLGVRSD